MPVSSKTSSGKAKGSKSAKQNFKKTTQRSVSSVKSNKISIKKGTFSKKAVEKASAVKKTKKSSASSAAVSKRSKPQNADKVDRTPKRVRKSTRAESEKKVPEVAKPKAPAHTSQRTVAQAFEDAQRFFLGQHGLQLLLLVWPEGVTETALASEVKIESPNDFLAMTHLLLPASFLKNVIEQVDAMTAVTCTAQFWKEHLWPLGARARQHAKAGRVCEALGEVLSFILYTRSMDGWMLGEEPHSTREACANFFINMSYVWKKVMKASDAQLRLKPAAGHPAGYRKVIHDLAAKVEEGVNFVLEGFDAMSDDEEELTPATFRLVFTGTSTVLKK